MESCACRLGEPPWGPLAVRGGGSGLASHCHVTVSRDGWWGLSAYTLTKRTCYPPSGSLVTGERRILCTPAVKRGRRAKSVSTDTFGILGRKNVKRNVNLDTCVFSWVITVTCVPSVCRQRRSAYLSHHAIIWLSSLFVFIVGVDRGGGGTPPPPRAPMLHLQTPCLDN